METSLKSGFAQIFSCCPKKLSCPNFGGVAAPLVPPTRTPMTLLCIRACNVGLSVFGGLVYKCADVVIGLTPCCSRRSKVTAGKLNKAN